MYADTVVQGKISLIERNETYDRTGYFEGKITGNKIVGTWTPADKKRSYPFILTQSEQTGFTTHDENGSIIYIRKSGSPGDSMPVITYYSTHPDIARKINGKVYFPTGFDCDYFVYRNFLNLKLEWEGQKFMEQEYYIFNLENGDTTSGLELFRPEKRDELLGIISKEIYRIYDEEMGDCFQRPEKVTWKGIEIVLQQKEVDFRFVYGYMTSCRAEELGVCSMSWKQLEPYLTPEKPVADQGRKIKGDFDGDGEEEIVFTKITSPAKFQEKPYNYELLSSCKSLPVYKNQTLSTSNDVIWMINEGDLNGIPGDEISLYLSPLNGGTYNLITYTCTG
ncbi:MAG TPA: hypothetical protein VD905_18915, partial [Flavobacteriales bacterium]|nr:hypothetical protein [Flavobacteriales bacterium]